MQANILKETVMIVSSNEAFQHVLYPALSRAGYSIRPVRSQQEGLQVLRTLSPAIVIVDRSESGFAQLHHALPDYTPILTVSNHPGSCDESHCVLDLEDGATRAVCNASPTVIVALAHAVLRRQRWEQPTSERFSSGGVTIDFPNYEVKVRTSTVSLTPTQFRILRSLAMAPGHFLSRQALFDQVWGKGFAIDPHTLDVNLCSLRRTLHSSGAAPDFIETVIGVGFKLRLTEPFRPVHHIPTAPTLSQIPHPTISPNWNPRRAPEMSRHSVTTWGAQLRRSLSVRRQSTPRLSAANSTLLPHIESRYAVADSACKRP